MIKVKIKTKQTAIWYLDSWIKYFSKCYKQTNQNIYTSFWKQIKPVSEF